VVPLSEDCGFIEWVPDTLTLRSACQGSYEAAGLFDRRLTNAGIKKLYDGFSVRCLLLPFPVTCSHAWRIQFWHAAPL
jgi:hypothetical protein